MASSGTALAILHADVALLNDDLTCLVGLIHLAKACQRTIWVNIGAAMSLKFIVLVLAVLGSVRLWVAVIADVAGLLFVVGNGTRLLFFDFAEFSTLNDSNTIQHSPYSASVFGDGKLFGENTKKITNQYQPLVSRDSSRESASYGST